MQHTKPDGEDTMTDATELGASLQSVRWLKGSWPYIATLVGAVWAVFTWAQAQKDQTSQRRVQADQQARIQMLELQKPFLEKKVALFFEASQIGGLLATREPKTKEWGDATNRALVSRQLGRRHEA